MPDDPCKSLYGLEFVAKSGNRGTFHRLEDGAVRFIWKRRPLAIERVELEAWVSSLLDVDITSNVGIETEAEALAKWRKNKDA